MAPCLLPRTSMWCRRTCPHGVTGTTATLSKYGLGNRRSSRRRKCGKRYVEPGAQDVAVGIAEVANMAPEFREPRKLVREHTVV